MSCAFFAEGGITRTGGLMPFQRGLEKIMRGMDAPIVPVALDGVWGSIFSFAGGKFFWKWPRQFRRPVAVNFGRPCRLPPRRTKCARLLRNSSPGQPQMDAEKATDAKFSFLIPWQPTLATTKRERRSPALNPNGEE